jgi:hypothetical protein
MRSAGIKPQSTGHWTGEISPPRAGKKLAVAVVHCDFEGFRAEVEFERAMTRNSSSVTPQPLQGSASRAHQNQAAIGGS